MIAESPVLLIDDDPQMTEVMALLLRANGLTVSTANTPSAAFAALAAGGLRATVTDLHLGDAEQGGIEWVSTLRRRWPEVPLLVMSGDQGAEYAAREAGASEFLLKPVTPEDLTAALERAAPSH